MAECIAIDPDTTNGPKCGCALGACALGRSRCFEDHAPGEYCEFCPCGDPGDCSEPHA